MLKAPSSARAPAQTSTKASDSGISTGPYAWGNKYLKYDIFHKKYLKYKQKYLNLKNKLFSQNLI